HKIWRQIKRRTRRHHEVEQRNENADCRQGGQKGERAAVERSQDEVSDHASTARPFKANSPRGRFWIKRMISTRIAILASTAPAYGSRNLLAIPSVNAPTSMPHRLPTPPNTTTMNESMMYDCPRLGPTFVNWLRTTPAIPAPPDPSPKVMASTHSVRMPIASAIVRFCETARMSRP